MDLSTFLFERQKYLEKIKRKKKDSEEVSKRTIDIILNDSKSFIKEEVSKDEMNMIKQLSEEDTSSFEERLDTFLKEREEKYVQKNNKKNEM